MTPVPRVRYGIGVPRPGYWRELLNTDAGVYGGSNMGNAGGVTSEPTPMHGEAQTLFLTLPPLATIFLSPSP
jgi:1,4-alpha-glucan branching enzyme